MSYFRRWPVYWERRPSRFESLVKQFGEVVSDIKLAFFELEKNELDDLFYAYGSSFGKHAEAYARKTFHSWKTSQTKLSGRTMERLIELVPPHLSCEQRIRLLRKLIAKYKIAPNTQTIRIDISNPKQGLRELDNLLKSMSHNQLLANLPTDILDAANWLYNDDMTAARAVVSEIDRRENEAVRKNAKKEINLLTRAISSKQIRAANYKVTMPAGEIRVVAYTPSLFAKILSILSKGAKS